MTVRPLRHELTYALADAAPDGWLRVDLNCRITGDALDCAADVLLADGTVTTMEVPPEAVEFAAGLRRETGWAAMRFLVDPPTRFRFIQRKEPDPGPAAEGPLSAEEQNHLWTRIANLVARHVPTDWGHVTLTYRAIGDHIELTVLVRRLSDGGWYRWDPPEGVAERLARLRAGMYRPGRGTWFQAVGDVLHDISIEYEYTWDAQPAWDADVPMSALAGELTTFRREAARIPGWLRDRVGAVAVATLGGAAEALRAAEDAAAELELDPARYRVGEAADGAWCLVPEDDRWAVYLSLGGKQLAREGFDTASEAVRYFVGHLYLYRTAFRDELPPDAKRQTDEWPIQPVGGDVGLQLYGGKRIVTLPPGTEMDRYGDPSGNTLYAARTEFTHRSQPAEDQQLEFHVYRSRRPVRAIVGSPIPWYDQTGGGTAYVLERSIADLLADGVLEEIEQATTRPPD
ncbi:TNT domain-containing protein [Amycolatopsis sp. YIM 10]|uniref:TNT domain-containing protein n=1 Tax=Amycolatopsis sp. YIM 10 TaxID=2653857 RepID=UPI0012900B14|nr:TNT domain-containing protein [Amycolatopsis sp. YIM 10]QFU92107.1 hypothetical protein YIM_34730 [Amycolatopsis sp. YIM 10]